MVSIFDITGVERDECIGHFVNPDNLKYGKDDILTKCSNIKLSKDGIHDNKKERIDKHNSGEICLAGCLISWEERRKSLYKLLKNISEVCDKQQIEWILYYGGLIGWYRNEELLPWDPDLDILMNISVIDKYTQLGIFDPNKMEDQTIYEDDDVIIKLNETRKDQNILGRIIDKHTLLYCDIFGWKKIGEDKVFIYRVSENNEHLIVDKNNFFPLKKEIMKSPFGNIKILIPSNPRINLETRYKDINVVPFYEKDGKYYKPEKIITKIEKFDTNDSGYSCERMVFLIVFLFIIFVVVYIWKTR